jgi:ABC-type multidrug transport system ATPase subunit
LKVKIKYPGNQSKVEREFSLSKELRMLSIENLSKTYANGIQALRNVSLEIPRGMFGLVGPNGAGKSTLMRTIATLQEPDTGNITMNGLDVLREKEEVRKILGYLPQEFGVYPKITTEKMLDHLAVLKGIMDPKERRKVVNGLISMTNLERYRKRKLGTFSGGMKQRFGIAQALLGNPDLIIVDEPTAGLDPEERNRFLNLLSEIGENVVVILSTHIVEDVSDLCSHMAIISEGKVLESGQPRDLVKKLEGQIWQKVISKAEFLQYEEKMSVISTRLYAGKTMIHVLSSTSPGIDFEPVDVDLKDVYFSTLKQASSQAA